VGYVLTDNGPGFAPSWQPGATPEPGFQWSSWNVSSAATTVNICLGQEFTPMFDVEFTHLTLRITPDAGKTYMCSIVELNVVNTIKTIIQQFDITAAVNANPTGFLLPMPVAQTFIAGVRYAILFSKSNGPPGNGIKIWTGLSNEAAFPCQNRALFLVMNYAVPSVGAAIASGGPVLGVNMRWRQQ